MRGRSSQGFGCQSTEQHLRRTSRLIFRRWIALFFEPEEANTTEGSSGLNMVFEEWMTTTLSGSQGRKRKRLCSMLNPQGFEFLHQVCTLLGSVRSIFQGLDALQAHGEVFRIHLQACGLYLHGVRCRKYRPAASE